MRHVISLSSIPPRFNLIGPCLQGLLAQKARPEAIELYIPRSYRRFPEWGGGLPDVPEGVTIIRVDEDLGPATKILPAARAWRGQDIALFYGDDDRVYGPDWVSASLKLWRKHSGSVLCGAGFSITARYGYPAPDIRHPRLAKTRDQFWTFGFQVRRIARRVQRSLGLATVPAAKRLIARSGYAEIAEGYGGVMVRPEYFDDTDWVIPPALWAVDDIWLSGRLARRGIPIWVDQTLEHVSPETLAGESDPLYRAVIDGLDRERANRACIEYMRETYGIWGGTVKPNI